MDQLNQSTCDNHPQQSRHTRQDETFGKDLTHESESRGAGCAANGKFTLSSPSACEQEIRDIDAGDQQDESDRAERELQRHPKSTGNLVSQGYEFGAKLDRLGCSPGQFSLNDIEFV